MKQIKKSLMVAVAATALVTAQNSHAMLTSAALKGLNGLNKLKSANSLSTKNLKSLPTMSRVRFSDKSANSPKFNFNLSKRQDETLAPQTWSGSTSKLRESAVTLWERLTGKKSGQTSADLEAVGKKSEKNSNNGDESTQHQSSFVTYKIAQAKSSLLAALGLAAGVAYCENEDEQQNQASSDTNILNDAPHFDSMFQIQVKVPDSLGQIRVEAPEQNKVTYSHVRTVQGESSSIPAILAFVNDKDIISTTLHGHTRKWTSTFSTDKYESSYTSNTRNLPDGKPTTYSYVTKEGVPATFHCIGDRCNWIWDGYATSDWKDIVDIITEDIVNKGGSLLGTISKNTMASYNGTSEQSNLVILIKDLGVLEETYTCSNGYSNAVVMPESHILNASTTKDLMPGQAFVARRIKDNNWQESVIQLHDTCISNCTFSKDNRVMATCDDAGTIKVWSIDENSNLSHLSTIPNAHTGPILNVALNYDGSKILSRGGNDEIKEWSGVITDDYANHWKNSSDE